MAFTPEFLDELKARAGIADIIGRRVRLRKKGRGEHSGLCPFHKEKTPSFTVNEDKGFYHCFGCQAHGSVFDFVMETEGLNFPEAVERLATDAGMEVPRATPEEKERQRRRKTLEDVTEAAARFFERQLAMPEGRRALEYLEGRGLTEETRKRFRLGFAPDSREALKPALARDGVSDELMVEAGLLIQPKDALRQPYDRFRGRVMFPIADRRGRVVAFGGRTLNADGHGSGRTGGHVPKYLNSPETLLFQKRRTLYGLDLALAPARQAGTITVVEGYTDVTALAQAGIEHAVAPLGTALTEEHLDALWRLVPEPALCFDGDEAGVRAAAKVAERALPRIRAGHGLRFAALPAGEDPASLVARHGRQAMEDAMRASRPLSDFLWHMETGGRSLDLPEERARLQKRFEDLAREIGDATFRRHFITVFRDRVGATRRRPDTRGATRRVAPAPSFDRLLIAAVIRHPGVFDLLEEALGRMSLEDPDMDALRQAVLVDGLDTENSLADQLRTDPAIDARAPFLAPAADLDDVRAGCLEILQRRDALAQDTEIHELAGRLGEEWNVPDEKRLMGIMEVASEKSSA